MIDNTCPRANGGSSSSPGWLLDPHRHDGRAYWPTGPTLLSGADIADVIGEALGRQVRHVDVSRRMFMKAVRASAKQMGADMFFQSSLA
jgi:NAD(P)H dehydrogenase (quinone)